MNSEENENLNYNINHWVNKIYFLIEGGKEISILKKIN